MLQISKLNAWYGASHALQDITLEVAKGEIVTSQNVPPAEAKASEVQKKTFWRAEQCREDPP